MRIAGTALFFAVVILAALSLAWFTAAPAPTGAIDGARVLARFEHESAASREIDLASRYAGRLDLLDPRLALPTWHRHARDDAAGVYRATKACPAEMIMVPDDVSLAKAYRWHAESCVSTAVREGDIELPPFLHPSGKSYAALALAHGPSSIARDHTKAFHVTELASVDAALLDRDPDAQVLAKIPFDAWAALARGDRVVLAGDAILVADFGPLGIAKLRVHPRRDWNAFAMRSAIALTERHDAPCARPATPDLCWEPTTPTEQHRLGFEVSIASSAAVALVSSIALAIAFAREKKRIHDDRVHVLRTLTHELRTPATSLRLDIEPIRAAYDELPERLQEPLLRTSEAIERLLRVLHRSTRYMALFETTAAKVIRISAIPSAKEMFDHFAEEWPDGVVIEGPDSDHALATDEEWLGIAIRNLLENASRHGTPPVTVRWSVDGDELVVRVSDHGTTPSLSLRRAIEPHERDRANGGLGLGLAIVDRIARGLGGRLTHEPSPTTFVLRMPAKRARR